MAAPSDTELDLLDRFVEERLGLSFGERRRRDLERGLGAAARAFGQTDLGAFVRWLLSGAPARTDIERFGGHLTVGETYFFRDPRAFAALEKVILPELIERCRPLRRLRIWCAGCSSGEEPYSIAILLHRLIPDIGKWSIDLAGTDINLRALRRGVDGQYSQWSFRGCDLQELAPFVRQEGHNRFAVSDVLRDMVRFSFLNQVEDTYPSLTNNTAAEDLVICRNVLMYFREDRAVAAAHRLFQCLVKGGYLLLGPAELHMLRGDDVEAVTIEGATCFRHTRPPAADTAGRPPVPAVEAKERPLPWQKPSPEVVPVPRPRASERRPAPPPSTAAVPRATAPSPDLLQEARALANQGKLEEALHCCDRILEENRTHAVAHYLKATISLEAGDEPAATVALRKTLYLVPNFIVAHFTAGMVARGAQRNLEAIRHFREARSLLRDRPADWEVPESDGMLAGRMKEVLDQLLDLGGK